MTDQYPPQPEYQPPGFPPPGDPYGQQQYGYPGHPGYPGYPPPDPGRSGFAIAALIFGILSVVFVPLLIFAVTFGIIALVQIGRRGQRGRGMAITGMVLSGVGVLVFIGVVAYSVTQLPDKTTSATQTVGPTVAPTTPSAEPTVEATPTEEATTADADYVIGECINDIKGDHTKVSCSTSHDGEVFGVFSLKNGKWPGAAAVTKQAEAGCDSRLIKYAKHPTRLDYLFAYPDKSSWPDDRRVVCVATGPNGKKLTGTIKR